MFREAFAEIFNSVDKYFSPFIQIKNNNFQRPSQFKDILPEHCQYHNAVPQYIGNKPDEIQFLCSKLSELSITELNLNMGCPYPMVTNKKQGAGILPHPDLIDKLLETACLSGLKISVKCRLGLRDNNDTLRLTNIFNQYPLTEIIIHPRTGSQMYKGTCDRTTFNEIVSRLTIPFGYNGDITSIAEYQKITAEITGPGSISLGRGLLRNPFLAGEIKGTSFTTTQKKEMLFRFHTKLLNLSLERFSDERQAILHLYEFWTYFHQQFDNGQKVLKSIKKAKNLIAYKNATQTAFF